VAEREKRSPDLWFQNGLSDEVVRAAMAARRQMRHELPDWAAEHELTVAQLFIAHELLAQTWKYVSGAGVKERSLKLAEALADITQLLVDLTGRTEEQISGQYELERRRRRG
jgi:hypothetical protein